MALTDSAITRAAAAVVAMNRIAEILRQDEWDSETPELIAEVVQHAGWEI